jgi:hypothetical protein
MTKAVSRKDEIKWQEYHAKYQTVNTTATADAVLTQSRWTAKMQTFPMKQSATATPTETKRDA